VGVMVNAKKMNVFVIEDSLEEIVHNKYALKIVMGMVFV
jgi:hypothetical protein